MLGHASGDLPCPWRGTIDWPRRRADFFHGVSLLDVWDSVDGTVDEKLEATGKFLKAEKRKKRIAYYRSLAQDMIDDEMLDYLEKHEGKQDFRRPGIAELEEMKEALFKLLIAKNYSEIMDDDNDEDKTGKICKVLGHEKKHALTEDVEVSMEEGQEHKRSRLTESSQNKGEDVASGETKSPL